MINGHRNMLGKMPENMKRNITGNDMKIDLLKKKIKAKQIGKIKEVLSGKRHG